MADSCKEVFESYCNFLDEVVNAYSGTEDSVSKNANQFE
jgi:hypothetical protein